jgi:hypothetical protein
MFAMIKYRVAPTGVKSMVLRLTVMIARVHLTQAWEGGVTLRLVRVIVVVNAMMNHVVGRDI